MLRLFRCPGVLPDYGHCSVMIKRWCNPPWTLSLLSLVSLLLFLHLSLASSALSKLSLFLLITSGLNRHFGATSASLRIEDRVFTQPLCSQAIHRLWAFDLRYKHQNGNGPGNNKADLHIALQPFSPSLSKRFFSLPLPSIQMSSINNYSNGTPVNNRGQALEMWVRMKLISREYYLVQQFFVNYKVTTARQLRISKDGTMGRMNWRQRSYNKKPCSTGKCVWVYIPALKSKGSQRPSVLCSSAYA